MQPVFSENVFRMDDVSCFTTGQSLASLSPWPLSLRHRPLWLCQPQGVWENGSFALQEYLKLLSALPAIGRSSLAEPFPVELSSQWRGDSFASKQCSSERESGLWHQTEFQISDPLLLGLVT